MKSREYEKVLAAFVKAARHTRNLGIAENGITLGQIKREATEAEMMAEHTLGWEKYQQICNEAFEDLPG